MEIKGTGKRLIPKRDIDYLKELKANHSDPSASWGGTEVVANPTLAGTEGDLTGLQVGDTKYKVPEVINVVANPTLEGTEDPLTSLQVGDTKYKNKFYHHHIKFNGYNQNLTPLTQVYIELDLYTKDSTPFTNTSFLNYMKDNFFSKNFVVPPLNNNYISLVFYVTQSGSTPRAYINYIQNNEGTLVSSSAFFQTLDSFVDTVVEV